MASATVVVKPTAHAVSLWFQCGHRHLVPRCVPYASARIAFDDRLAICSKVAKVAKVARQQADNAPLATRQLRGSATADQRGLARLPGPVLLAARAQPARALRRHPLRPGPQLGLRFALGWRFVKEPSIFQAARQRSSTQANKGQWLAIFPPALLRTTVLTSLLATGAQGGYYAITTWLPTYLKSERKLSVIGTAEYIGVVIIGSFMPMNNAQMLALDFPLGFFASGIFSGMGAFLTENFPTRMQGSGQGFACNFGRGIGALNPTFVGLLSATLPLGQSIGTFAAIAYGSSSLRPCCCRRPEVVS